MAANPKENPPPETESTEQGETTKGKRTAAPGVRHRRDNGPAELFVNPVPHPDLQSLGTLTRWSQEVIAGGPRALIAAEHSAAKLAEKFGLEVEAAWCLTTKWLTQHIKDNPMNGRHTLSWRPRYLAILSLSRSDTFACRGAKISRMTSRRHRQCDPEFAEQCLMAEQQAIELLHDVTMKSAIEGECEPVLWQGIPVAWVRKVDNRLRIEMLRAHMPKTFKTPGAKVAINTGNVVNNMAFFGPEQTAEIQRLRQESLRHMAEQRGLPLPVATVTDA